MKNLQDLFEIIGKRKFLQRYTTLNSEGGVQSRINGKDTTGKKEGTLTEEEREKIKAGLDALEKDIKKVKKTL